MRALLAMPLLFVLLLSPASAVTLKESEAKLPHAQSGMSAVWTGEAVYLFGGSFCPPSTVIYCDMADEVLRYDPASDRIETVGSLPSPRSATSAAWDGRYAYVFGGETPQSKTVRDHSHDVLRFDPETNEAKVVAQLPHGISSSAAVWGGDQAYVFGGTSYDAGNLDRIVSYDPATGDVRQVQARLPPERVGTGGRYGAGAAWTGKEALVLAGYSDMHWFRAVARFDPTTGEIAQEDYVLPEGVYEAAVTWAGGRAWMLGGYSSRSEFSIVSYDPATGTAEYDAQELPEARSGAVAVGVGDSIFLFGGTHDDSILRIDVPPAPARDQSSDAADMPGFGLVAVFAALAAVALVFKRRA